jgi:hypothetical protein
LPFSHRHSQEIPRAAVTILESIRTGHLALERQHALTGLE